MKPIFTRRVLKYLLVLGIIIPLAYALIWVILQGYLAPWTGFGDYTKPSSEFVRGKTLWDWIQLLIIPLVGSIGVYLLNRTEREIERQRAEERSKLERDIALDRQRETALQSYVDRIADLLLKGDLQPSGREAAQNVARVRTLTVLAGLDIFRRRTVIQFLHEAKLISATEPTINLQNAILKGASLDNAFLQGVNLSQAFLKEADLENAKLQGANLYLVHLGRANLKNAHLEGANLEHALLDEANFQNADLKGANLKDTWMVGTILTGADLSEANLAGADMRFAQISDEQLATVQSLSGAILPNGTKHD